MVRPSHVGVSPAQNPHLLHLLQALNLSITTKSLLLTQQAHAQTYRLGLAHHSILATKLISAYSLCKLPSHSLLIFNSNNPKNAFLCNALINAYVDNLRYPDALTLFSQMGTQYHVSPDDYTMSALLKLAGELRDLVIGKSVHSWIAKTGFVSDSILMNSLMSMYRKCGSGSGFEDVRKVFDEMPQRTSSSWNLLISAYGVYRGSGFSGDVREIVERMRIEGVGLDGYTVSTLLPLCPAPSDGRRCDFGREIHCYVLRRNVGLGTADVHVCCCLIDMYSRAKNVVAAWNVFDGMSSRNIVAWTCMITGCVHNGLSEKALMLFRKMQVVDGIEPNAVSLISVLPACSSLCSFMEGKQIHAFAIRKEISYALSLRNTLIDMYAKCGSLDCARKVFDEDQHVRDSITWSLMIAAYGLHGDGDEAIYLFDNMLKLGIEPDNITIVGVLSACCRSGFLREGINIYKFLVMDFGISPTPEICSCVVDMLGRSGQLDRALEFINSMPFDPGANVWGALLDASIIHDNSEMWDLAHKFLTHLEPENPSNYISLSNVLASSGKWDAVIDIRSTMKDRGMNKLPGCSWISINSEMHSFYVADKNHPFSPLIYEVLDNLFLTIKESFPCFDNFDEGPLLGSCG
ncbi:hypothetical protein Syun_030008 [Stephania yunnanensis]|uniref:Chlororespiratory reduction 21 n=1 Tax=Stephania yunnanensis TaxID=152371 RepID=A0AAP0HHT5_9MAGN